jgi:hypothetical protein
MFCGDVRYVWQTLVKEIYKSLIIGELEILNSYFALNVIDSL